MKITTTLAAIFAFLSSAALSQAGEIVGYTPFPGINSVAGVAIIPPVAPNNDDVVGTSPNDLWVTQKDYIAVAPVDIVFFVEPTGGVTEYSFREGVQNSTGIDWTGYTVQLGFGTGAGFMPSTDNDGLDFDDPDYTSAPSFISFFPTANTVTEDIIVASGGVHPNGFFSVPDYTFTVDVPDGISQFTLRQQPIIGNVPEPSTLLMAIPGLFALVRSRRRVR